MKYTVQRQQSRIAVTEEGGACVAWMADGSDVITYDTLADTCEVLGLICHRDEMASAGLDPCTLGMVAAMPGRSIGPESVPPEFPKPHRYSPGDNCDDWIPGM